MATSKNLKDQKSAQSTLSQEVFPANHSVALGSDEARKMTATSGRRCFELYGRRLRDGSLVKTLAASLLGTEEWYSTKCFLTWKPRVTKSGRLLFQLAPSVPRTGETGSGLLLTPTVIQTEEEPEKMRARPELAGYKNGTKWGSLASQVRFGMVPTPRAGDAKGGKYQYDQGNHERPRPTLSGMINLLPTPTAQPYGNNQSSSKGSAIRPSIAGIVGLLRTPDANMMRGTSSPKSLKRRIDKKLPLNINNHLRAYELGMMPTPNARDSRGTSIKRDRVPDVVEVGGRTGLKLQPSFALWMMGYPTDHLDLEDGEMPLSKAQEMRLSRKSQK